MARRVQEDPAGRTGLIRMFGRAEIDHGGFGGVEVVDQHVAVHLLGSYRGDGFWALQVAHIAARGSLNCR